MAAAPPPAPLTPTPPQTAATPPKPRSSGCFGCGCGGCLLVVVLVVLLVGGAGWWFFVVQASAGVSAPASLVVINQPVTVDGNPGIAGQSLSAGSTVSTGTGGHGVIVFPHGSSMRLTPNTTGKATGVQLQKTGDVQAISLAEKIGRTFTNVQHLAS